MISHKSACEEKQLHLNLFSMDLSHIFIEKLNVFINKNEVCHFFPIGTTFNKLKNSQSYFPPINYSSPRRYSGSRSPNRNISTKLYRHPYKRFDRKGSSIRPWKWVHVLESESRGFVFHFCCFTIMWNSSSEKIR